MSALTRYPVPQAAAAGKVDGSRLYFGLTPTVASAPILEFLRPQQATDEDIPVEKANDSRLYFRLPDPSAAGGAIGMVWFRRRRKRRRRL